MRLLRSVAGIAACLGCTAAVLAISSAPAAADSCPSEETVLPYDGNNPPYQCAQMEHSGKKSIGAWDTKSWTKTISFGYPVKSHCYYRSDKDVSVIESWATSSYTATATNWDTGTRHWAAGVLFTTGNVNNGTYKNGCDSHGGINNSIEKISSIKMSDIPDTLVRGQTYVITAEVSPSDAKGTVAFQLNGKTLTWAQVNNGKVTFWYAPQELTTYQVTVAYSGNTSNCPQTAEYCGWTPSVSKAQTINIVSPTTASASAKASAAKASAATAATAQANPVRVPAVSSGDLGPNFRLTTLQSTRKMPARLSQRCPRNSVLVNAEVLTDSSKRDPQIAWTTHGATVRPADRMKGAEVTLQITCRQQGARRLSHNRLGYGTPGADRMSTIAKSGVVFGGPGHDRLTVAHNKGGAFGGLGNDRIFVRTSDSVAIGGPGHDRLTSTATGKSLLVGREGRDVLIGSPRGTTRLNAADGTSGDVVVCRSSRNQALVDAGDVVRGNCGKVRRA